MVRNPAARVARARSEHAGGGPEHLAQIVRAEFSTIVGQDLSPRSSDRRTTSDVSDAYPPGGNARRGHEHTSDAFPGLRGCSRPRQRPQAGHPTRRKEGLKAIWIDILGVDAIGLDDDFFELGGHSLLVADAIARACATFNVALPVRAMFAAPTVRGLAQSINDIKLHGGSEEPIPRAARITVDKFDATGD